MLRCKDFFFRQNFQAPENKFGLAVFICHLPNINSIYMYSIHWSLLDDGGAIEAGDNPNDLKYNVEIKIVDLGENFQFPKPNSLGYEDLKTQINDNFKPLFKKIPGYKKFKLTDIKE